MTCDAPTQPRSPAADGPRLDHVTITRWARPLGLVLFVALFILNARQSHPGSGRGSAAGLAVALAGFAAAVILLYRTRSQPVRETMLLTLLIGSSTALVVMQPNGPGVIGIFLAVTVAALRVPLRVGVAVAAVALIALAVAGLVIQHRQIPGVVLNESGVVAFYLMALFANRVQQANERSRQLLLELEQSRAAQAEAAAIAERQWLAREMHDVLAHSLSGLTLQLEGARMLAAQTDVDAELAASIERAHHLARTGLEEARRAIGMLRDDELPGPDRLSRLADDFTVDTGVPCRVTVEGDARELDAEGRVTLYRVAQEALTNVRRHARADRVEVRLQYEETGTRLVVEDFGPRADPPSSDGGGYGLTGMRERAELLGGTLQAGPTAGGFRVELWVPA